MVIKIYKLHNLLFQLLEWQVIIHLLMEMYKLLLILIKHSGQILSRNIILERLWDIDGEFVDDNTLSVYIRRLREKL